MTDKPEQALVVADKIAPRFCTTVRIEILNNKHVVLSMIYADGVGPASLIERIVIDIDHARKLSEVLKEATDKAFSATMEGKNE